MNGTTRRNLVGCTALLLAAIGASSNVPAWAQAPATPAQARPPVWAAKGAYVFRISTPDGADVLPRLEQGHAIVANLLDGTVPQITISNGLIGHDHPGAWNWDGLWPCWNRATFRAGSFEKLAEFMVRAKRNWNVYTGFHLNLTDVNIGLRDYPESRAFFRKLVETKSIYCRDWNKETNRREGVPYVPQTIPNDPNPVEIFALVNYKRFWDSGLAKQMLDEFYGRLPFAPPVLYVDVLNSTGGNFATGAPDGPLGGSEQTQIEGMQAIADYLHAKGTDLGTEGPRPFLGKDAQGLPRAGYIWYHGDGFSADDYSVIAGGAGIRLAAHHVYGNPGAFNVSPVASTRSGLDKVRAHYAALLAGKPGTKSVAGLATWRIAYREGNVHDEFDIPGTGDGFRGDWADLVNNFYLATIQELYHIGNRSVRQRSDSIGAVHLGKYRVSGPGGTVTVSVPDFAEPEWRRLGAQKGGELMIETPVTTRVTVSRAGKYALKVHCFVGDRCLDARLGIYVNGSHHRSFDHLRPAERFGYELDAGEIELREGENLIVFDCGAIRASWSDGSEAEWTTPYLHKNFKAWNGDVTFAKDYDRMWPDTWSGRKKIYFFSWDGTSRNWKLPADWSDVPRATLYPLTPDGRGKGVPIAIKERAISPSLLPQVPYILVPDIK
jgi:hypothetical protein